MAASVSIYPIPEAIFFFINHSLFDWSTHPGGHRPMIFTAAVFANNYRCCIIDGKV